MRILADENIPGLSIEALRTAGHSVEAVHDRAPGLDDPDVIRLARRLGAVLLTFDSDIGERIFKDGDAPPPGVIYLRFVQAAPEEAARIVTDIFGIENIDVSRSFVTYRNGRVRHQPLPIV
ncbi:MAG: DUF5615 family PIN-like protein [Bacteroidota bacterium]